MIQNQSGSKKGDNLFTLLLYRFVPYWPLFAVLVILGVAGAYLYLRLTPPIYQASATIIIKDERRGVDDSKIMEPMDAFSSSKIVENELEVIKSRVLLKQVVNALSLYAPIMEDAGFQKYSAYTTSPIVVVLKQPERIRKQEKKPLKVYFTFDPRKEIVRINNKNYALNQWVKSPYGEIKFLQNIKQTQNTENPFYFTFVHPKTITNNLISQLEAVQPNKLSTVLYLNLKDEVPQRGEDILNHLIYNYKQVSVTNKNKLAANTLAFINDRITTVENELDEVEKEVQKYKSNQGAVDLSEQGKLYLENLGDNDRKISELTVQIAVLDKVEKYVISKNNDSGIVPSTLGIKDEGLSKLLEKLYNSELEYERLRKTTAENNPILVSVVNEINKIRPSILENVRSLKNNLNTSLANLSATTGKYNSVIETIPQKERILVEISRKKAVKNELYSFLLKKREETALSNAPSPGESQVIDVAEYSEKPVSPKSLIIYLLAVGAASAIVVAFVIGKEMFNHKILFRNEIEECTSVPVIGEVFYHSTRKKKQPHNFSERLLMEQFKDLRVALGLFGHNSNKRKILITSNIEGEGKSFVSEHLGKSLALSKRKVVLLNFDLRKPQASDIYPKDNTVGIAEYLSGQVAKEEIIKLTNITNLFVIPAGNTTVESSDLLIDSDLSGLFDLLEQNFDVVIVDTPPVEVAIDACLLSKYCDTTLLIARHAHTPKWVVQRIDQNKNLSLLNNLSIVFNGVKNRGYLNNRYGYSYGYNQKKKNYKMA